MRDISIIGVGNLGGALASALNGAGYDVTELIVRNSRIARKLKRTICPDSTIIPLKKITDLRTQIVFITTDDPAIESTAKTVGHLIHQGQYIFHTSGSLSSAILAPLRAKGALIGSIHPLTSISDPFRPLNQFEGIYCCVEGDAKAVRLGNRLVRAIGGRPFTIETALKPLYHAAAVTAAGHVTTLFAASIEMMTACGLDRNTATNVLLPLLASTVSNLKRQTPDDALTGTFARLDIQAFLRHISVFERTIPTHFVQLYLEVGNESLNIVERREGPSETLAEFRKAILMAQRKFR